MTEPTARASSPAPTAAAASARPRGWREIFGALGRRKTLVMFALGAASGLPFSALIGTLNAWLTEAEISVGTIGVLSLIGLAYAFNFVWSPALQNTRPPLLARFGGRRGWMIVFQLITVGAFFLIALSDPARDLGSLAAAAALAAVASASLHIVVDAWRIEVADDDTPVDLLSSVYQFGFRLSSFLAGAVALVLAERIGWPETFFGIAAIAFGCFLVSLWAPEPDRSSAPTDMSRGAAASIDLGPAGDLAPAVRAGAVIAVLLGWVAAGWALVSFAADALTGVEGTPSATAFTRANGPWIVGVTVVAPAFIAAGLLALRARQGLGGVAARLGEVPLPGRVARAADAVYAAVLAPLVDYVDRFRFAVILLLAIALLYRFTDQVWGAFAFTFYLGDPAVAAGALQHTLDEVFIASKTFGVVMTISGIALGGVALLRFGRMPVLFAGAVASAVTNLLYVDLARGGAGLDTVLRPLGLFPVFGTFGLDERMARLMTTIAGENLAGGVASAAFVAYLSSTVNPRFAAVQYALLASLALLIGTIGRGALGELVDTQGFAVMFEWTFWLGGVAVVLVALEWLRQSRMSRTGPEGTAPVGSSL